MASAFAIGAVVPLVYCSRHFTNMNTSVDHGSKSCSLVTVVQSNGVHSKRSPKLICNFSLLETRNTLN
jgi:hypothetical protein